MWIKKKSYICVIRDPKGEEKDDGLKVFQKKAMPENSPNLAKNKHKNSQSHLQIGYTQRSMPKHIIAKLLTAKDRKKKKKFLKAARETMH